MIRPKPMPAAAASPEGGPTLSLTAPPGARFTRDGGPGLEARIAAACERVRTGVASVVPDRIRTGLVLGGGYGRGEGGVLRAPGPAPQPEDPYNDLEFYLFTRGSALWNQRRYGRALHALEGRLTAEIGIDVEIKLITTAALRRASPSMFHFDLIRGHRRIEGGPELFEGCDRHADASAIPAHEATRLLMNRGAGLLFAQERLAAATFLEADADFVGRNHAKAALALGDAVLAVQGLYDGSCLERHRRLECLEPRHTPPLPPGQLRRLHAEGVEFKLHPVRSREPRACLVLRSRELVDALERVWGWIEDRRLGRPWLGACEYAVRPEPLLAELPAWRNRLVNARAFGARVGLSFAGARHPRERLLRALPLLLFPTASPRDAQTEAALDVLLRDGSPQRGHRIEAFRTLWRRFG